jgi:hypothetical protein
LLTNYFRRKSAGGGGCITSIINYFYFAWQNFLKIIKMIIKNPEYRRYSIVTAALTAAIIFLQKIQISDYL